jgi:nifR3 family TIM-barrel protein
VFPLRDISEALGKSDINNVDERILKIGNYVIKNSLVLAPMAGVSQMPFRRLALKMGAGLAPTELVSAKGLFFDSLRTKSYLIHDRSIEAPFCVQLFGGEALSMAHAAHKAMTMGADIIDINMGCPVKKVTKIQAGSALLCDPLRASDIVTQMLKETGYKIPITAKIRSGWDQNNINFIEVGRALEDAGIAALAIHPRTRAQGYTGKANWEHIALLKRHLKIPIIGNGDVLSLKDAKLMKRITGCDAVMIGRAALGNPWIFRDKEISPMERWQIVKEHLASHIELHRTIALFEGKPKESDQWAVQNFRSHLIWYSKGLVDGAKFRQRIMVADVTESMDLIDSFFMVAESAKQELIEMDQGIDYRQAFG